MLNQEAVKRFFLETSEWVLENNPTPFLNTHFPHSCSRLRDNGYLYYMDVWSEIETKNIVQSIGHSLIWCLKGPLWGINYDGWQEEREKIISLRKEGLINSFKEIDKQWKQVIILEKNGLKYENKISGQFSLFEMEESVSDYFKTVSYYCYRGRALVNLSV